MVESHEEKSCKLFDQAIYIYLISCRVKSSFRVELSSQASQFDLSAWIQLLNSIQHFFKKISIQLDLNLSTRFDAISLSAWNFSFLLRLITLNQVLKFESSTQLEKY